MLLLLACDTPPADTDPTDSAAAEVTFSDVTVTPATIPTVYSVRFYADGAGTGFVDFAPTGEPGWRATAALAEDGAWEALIVGLPASSTGEVTVGIGETLGPTTTVTTGDAPAWLSLVSSEGEPTPGFLVVGVEINPDTGAAILDTRGRPVWWSAAPEGLYGRLHTRARISPEGRVEYIAFGFPPPGTDEDGKTELVSVALDGSDVQRLPLPMAHHDFLYLPDGAMAWIDVEDRVEDGNTIRAETIVERAADGTERVVWSAWDTIPYLGELGAPAGYWTLGNYLEYIEADDSYAMSLRNVDTIVKVDRTTGVVDWTVGPTGTYVPDDGFDGQHGFDVLGDELLVFDNGTNGSTSRAIRYALADGVASTTWAYERPPLGSFVMGDVQELANDNLLVMFSTSGTADEVTPDGTLLSTFSYQEGTILGFVEWHDALVE